MFESKNGDEPDDDKDTLRYWVRRGVGGTWIDLAWGCGSLPSRSGCLVTVFLERGVACCAAPTLSAEEAIRLAMSE